MFVITRFAELEHENKPQSHASMPMFNLVERSTGYLFASTDLRELMDSYRAHVVNDINAMDGNRFLNTSPSDLADHYQNKYDLEAPTLKRDAMSADQREAQVDVRHDVLRSVTDRSRPSLVPGQRIEIEVPVEGDIDFLFVRPSTFELSPLQAEVRDNSLFFVFNIPHDAPPRDIKREVEKTLNEIEGYLARIRKDLDGFGQQIRARAEAAITARRTRLLENDGRAASLGIPLKTRPDAPRTYALPEFRRKITPSPPQASSTGYIAEFSLNAPDYENILSIIQNMTQVMERSPSAFHTMGEEVLRQHFLVQLNGQYEGAATAETFNVSGKTDILLRWGGKNAFIAECKFWKGPKIYRETVDQLLGYTAWRDTKTAILIFNRDTALTTVLTGVSAETVRHKNYKRTVDWKHESGFRYVFHQNGDPNREFLLTVLVFDVPGPPPAST